MDTNQTVLLRLLSKTLFGRTVELDDDSITVELLEEAKKQAVVACVYSALDQNILTDDAKEQWQKCSLSVIVKNIRVNYNHELLHNWLNDAGIPYVILKGCASAQYYPTPQERSIGDVDFLISEGDIEKISRIFRRECLVPLEEEHISHIVWRSNGMHLEMHFNIAGTPNGEAGELVREYTKDIFDVATIKKIDNGYAKLPSSFHHGLILLLHTCHHLTGEGIGLRHLCDWGVVEDKFSDLEFKELFEDKLKKIGLWKFAQVLTRTAIKYLHSDDKQWAECDEALADLLIEDILAGGNFGRKDNSRSIQTMMISNRGKDGVGKTSMIFQLMKSANNIIYHNWPLTKKHKLVLPIGWIYFGFRRLIRELTGKRNKTEFKHLIESALERRALYKQFCLYEREN